MSILLKGGTLVTINKSSDVLKADLLIDDNKIIEISKDIDFKKADKVIDVSGQFILPGFIQAHTHLCQALYRGCADDLALLEWLKDKIWPMEYCHNASSIKSSAQISLLEMQLLGTTSILDMATVNYTHPLLEEVEYSGMRYWGGKCLMDLEGSSGPLFQPLKESIKETEELIKIWHKKNDLINYAICPRFAVSCSDEMMHACAYLQKEHDLIIHTHASENKDEVQMIKDRTGYLNIEYFYQLGILNKKTVLVHGVHVTDHELEMMTDSKTPLVHCPSSNLKLASGIAPIEKYDKRGLTIGVGSDGAPCNNTMDPFMEMRLTALLQKPGFGPEAMPAKRALELCTIGGAKVLGVDHLIGSLEVGKLADIITVNPNHPSTATVENPYSSLVYSCSGRDVENVFINGRQIVSNKIHTKYNSEEVILRAKKELSSLIQRVQQLN